VHECNSWLDLTDKLQLVILEPEPNDSISWALEGKGQYITKSLYRFLTDRGVASKVVEYIWKVPLKIKKNLWQTFNKLQVAKCLVKWGWNGDSQCFLCGRVESIYHLVFGCYLAKLVWGHDQRYFSPYPLWMTSAVFGYRARGHYLAIC
jgi:hypothetical protein